MLRAIIVEDEELSVKRLTRLLAESGEIVICHAFMNPFEAYAYVKANQIDVAFLDIYMPEISGMRFASLLHEHDASIDVVFVTGYDHYAVQAFDLSALDYLLKPVTAQRMSKTLEKIRKSKPHAAVEPTMLKLAGPLAVQEEPSPQIILTEQETRILHLVTDGLTNKEIGIHMHITAETVKTHIKNLYRKLNVNNRVQALQRANELKILV